MFFLQSKRLGNGLRINEITAKHWNIKITQTPERKREIDSQKQKQLQHKTLNMNLSLEDSGTFKHLHGALAYKCHRMQSFNYEFMNIFALLIQSKSKCPKKAIYAKRNGNKRVLFIWLWRSLLQFTKQ